LNHQLRDAGGYFVRSTRTSTNYKLYALPGGRAYSGEVDRPFRRNVTGDSAESAL
jgi:hypothetical protein